LECQIVDNTVENRSECRGLASPILRGTALSFAEID